MKTASTTTPMVRASQHRKRAVSWGKRAGLTFTLPLILIIAWWLFSADSDSFFFPPLSEIIGKFPATWFEGRLVGDVLPSVVRLISGYLLAVILGVTVGVLIGMAARLRAFTEPTFEFFRAIPPPVLVPVLMIFLGIGDTMKIFVIFVGCIWPMLLNTIEGVRGIDEVLRDTSRVYKLRPATMLRTLILRGASPQIMTGARQALSIGIILMVISEMFAATNGLGFALVQFQRNFEIPEMWTAIILLGLVGVALSLVFRIVEHQILAWYRGLRRLEKGES